MGPDVILMNAQISVVIEQVYSIISTNESMYRNASKRKIKNSEICDNKLSPKPPSPLSPSHQPENGTNKMHEATDGHNRRAEDESTMCCTVSSKSDDEPKTTQKPTPIVLLLFFCCRCFCFFYLRSAAPVAKRVRGNGSGTSGGELRPLDREMAAQSAAPRSRTVPSNSSAPRSATREKSAPGAVYEQMQDRFGEIPARFWRARAESAAEGADGQVFLATPPTKP